MVDILQEPATPPQKIAAAVQQAADEVSDSVHEINETLRDTLGPGGGAFSTGLIMAGLGFAVGDVLGAIVGAALGAFIGGYGLKRHSANR